MLLTPFMAATFFNLPIEPPPHVILRSVEVMPSELVPLETTTPDLLQGLASSQPSGSGILPQPIYPAPSPSGSAGQGKSTPQTVQPSPTPAPQPQEQPKENWADRIWRRYKGGAN